LAGRSKAVKNFDDQYKEEGFEEKIKLFYAVIPTKKGSAEHK
jgi:hypothetical protein